MSVTMWKHSAFDLKTFGCGKIYYFNSIIVTNFVETLIPNVFRAYFGIDIF
jgi:hypothetical protein